MANFKFGLPEPIVVPYFIKGFGLKSLSFIFTVYFLWNAAYLLRFFDVGKRFAGLNLGGLARPGESSPFFGECSRIYGLSECAPPVTIWAAFSASLLETTFKSVKTLLVLWNLFSFFFLILMLVISFSNTSLSFFYFCCFSSILFYIKALW